MESAAKNAWFLFIVSQSGKSTTLRIRLIAGPMLPPAGSWGSEVIVARDCFPGSAQVQSAQALTEADPALSWRGILVYAPDVGGVPVSEAAGCEAMLTGVRMSCTDDDQSLAVMMPELDAF